MHLGGHLPVLANPWHQPGEDAGEVLLFWDFQK